MFSPTANFRHGSPLEVGYTPPSVAVSAGDVVVVGNGVRIAHSDIAVGIRGELAIGFGVYDVPKATTGGSGINSGTAVYWDPIAKTETLTATGNAFLGITVNTSLDADATQPILHLPPSFAFKLTNSSLTDNTGGVAGSTLAADVATTTIVIPVPALSALANAQTLSVDPGFNGLIKAINFRVGATPAATAAKLATLTGEVAGTPVTGGVVALTTAGCNAAGAQVAGSAVTALNAFTNAQAIGVTVSAVTAFVEGGGSIEIQVINTDTLAAFASLVAQLNAVTAVLAGEA